MEIRKKRMKKERIFSIILSLGIILTLGYGIITVVSTMNSDNNKDNIISLNDGEAPSVAINSEEPQMQDGAKINTDNNYSDRVTTMEEQLEDTADEHPFVLEEDMMNSVLEDAKISPATPQDVTAQNDLADNDLKEDSAQAVKEDKDVLTGVVNSNAVVKSYYFDESKILQRPVEGDVVLKYSMDTTTYFKTLGAYKCSDGIIISAPVGTNVAVAADGVVENVYTDEETGNTITVNIGNGYCTTYGMIGDSVVKPSDVVSAGQLLGKVDVQPTYYKEEGPGVYFKMTKDGQPVDPVAYFD